MANYRKSFNFRNGVQVDDDNLVVNANGLVGIGTTVPTESLDVRGTAKVVGLVTASSGIIKNLEVTGVTTITSGSLGNLNVNAAGIATAVSGVVTYYGDGSKLSDIPTSQWTDIDVGLGFTSIYNKGYVGVSTNDPRMNLQVGGNPLLTGTLPGGVGISSLGHIKATGVVTATQFVGDKFTGDVTGNINSVGVSTFTDLKIGSNITATLGVITATTFVGNVTGTVTGDVVGTASLASNLTGTPNITVGTITATEITANSINLPTAGIVTAKTELNVGTGGTVFTVLDTNKSAFGAANPDANLEIRTASGLSSVHLRSADNASIITLGRGSPTETTSGAIRFGNASAAFPYSSSKSLDIINYDTGNVNFYLEAGTAGVGTGDFHWHRRKNTSRLMSLTYEGNLGIGITSPSHKLSVSGISTFTGDAYFNNNITIDGNLNISAITATLTGNVTGNLTGNVNSTGISTFNDLKTTGNVGLGVDPDGDDLLQACSFIADRFIIQGSGEVGIKTDTIISNIELDVRGDVQAQYGLVVGVTTTSKCAVDMSSVVDVVDDGTSRASIAYMIPPRVTTSQRNALRDTDGNALSSDEAGAMIYNTSTNKLQVWNGSSWNDCF
tara:strand:+ start:5988 stop:7826 length:1839 start_codon:yes stop_codon:yes gene_type:complete